MTLLVIIDYFIIAFKCLFANAAAHYLCLLCMYKNICGEFYFREVNVTKRYWMVVYMGDP